jgi:hypothetical protein
MTATVIPPEELTRRRAERDRQRRERAAWVGSILDGLLDDDDSASAPAFSARDRETRR